MVTLTFLMQVQFSCVSSWNHILLQLVVNWVPGDKRKIGIKNQTHTGICSGSFAPVQPDDSHRFEKIKKKSILEASLA
jgi:hypothetical protein